MIGGARCASPFYPIFTPARIVPDAGITRAEACALLAGLSAERPTIVLAYDPVWFAHLPTGPHFMLAGHTHGGQNRFPGIGIVRTATKAPRR